MPKRKNNAFVAAMRAILTVFALPLLLVSGCTPSRTTANYEAILETYVGFQEVELVRKWGTPSRVHKVDGSRFLTYISENQVHVSGTAPSYKTTCTNYGFQEKCTSQAVGGSAARTYTDRCITTFELQDDIVMRWQIDGNDCKSEPLSSG